MTGNRRGKIIEEQTRTRSVLWDLQSSSGPLLFGRVRFAVEEDVITVQSATPVADQVRFLEAPRMVRLQAAVLHTSSDKKSQ